MHYPLHITLLLASFSILRDDVDAAKNGLNADVLTTLAKNVASVLSTTLLSDYQDPPSNQSSSSFLRRHQETQQSSSDHARSESLNASSKVSFGRYTRYTHGSSPPIERNEAFQDAYITNSPRYSKYFHPEAYAPYKYTASPDTQVSQHQLNIDETPESVSVDTRGNSIDADIKRASLHYANRYHQPPGFGYKPGPLHPLPNSNQYAQFGREPRYQHLPSQTVDGSEQAPDGSQAEGIDASADPNQNSQTARIIRRPFNFNYHGPFHGPYHQPFHGHQHGYYPHSEVGNPLRLVDHLHRGHSALGGYEYSHHFNHRGPYHDGFYPGYPGFYPHPFNDSFNPGNVEQGGGNGTYGPQPYGPPFFNGPKFGPQFPYQQPFYPNFYGHGRPVEPQNPPENQGSPEQMASPENGQGNGTANRPPYGLPPYGPYYQHGFNGYGGYPPLPFNGVPYHFGHGFHDHLFPRVKPFPYFNFYPGGYHHFPSVYGHPYGGYYPYNNNRATTAAEKPAEKSVNQNAEAVEPPANSEVEMLSETKSMAVNRYVKRASFSKEFVIRNGDKMSRDQLNQLS
ncbi:uncharacterized protein LOC143425693 [Xylocopa sonorina]|uniref:uncharacterized protein LOC143425693 n=1 Tax=Xylocopa sonorina TaxID=1818115 RepID=UPI00403B07A3